MASDKWRSIESDPGVFTDLIHGFGVDGVQVEEIFSFDDDSLEQMKPCHGLIFLFKSQQIDTSNGNLVEDERLLDEIFFVRQVIPNACATQAILSVLLTCIHEDFKLGSTLTEFKQLAKEFDATMRGIALAKISKIRDAHNHFARQQFGCSSCDDKNEEYPVHFIVYTPLDGHLYELDGLKEDPIDHGNIMENSEWFDKARSIFQTRLQTHVTEG